MSTAQNLDDLSGLDLFYTIISKLPMTDAQVAQNQINE
jgi:hypothetical protein